MNRGQIVGCFLYKQHSQSLCSYKYAGSTLPGSTEYVAVDYLMKYILSLWHGGKMKKEICLLFMCFL